MQENMIKRSEKNPMQTSYKTNLSVYQDCITEQDVFDKLEGFAKNRIKVPSNPASDYGFNTVSTKITRSDAADLIT